jgi:membrane protein YqaA with SNARE-associated domain
MFSVVGICVIAVLDSTIIFSLPLAVDIGVVLLSSRRPALFWFYAFLVSACSVLGAATTYYLGRRIGEAGLERFIPAGRLKWAQARLQHKGEIAMAALGLIPPPFPFTAITLTVGTLGLSAVRFLVALFGFRLVRFGSEAALAAVYGSQIVQWMRSDLFRNVAYVFMALLIAASVISIIQFMVNARRRCGSDSDMAA